MTSQWTRRLVVIGVYGAYATIVFCILALNLKAYMLDAFPGMIFAMAAWLGLLIFMRNKKYWAWGNAPASQLDERQIHARLNAYWSAYALFVTIVFVVMVVLMLGSDLMRIRTWNVNDVSALVWGVFLVGLSLPSAILMWNDRTLGTEDEPA